MGVWVGCCGCGWEDGYACAWRWGWGWGLVVVCKCGHGRGHWRGRGHGLVSLAFSHSLAFALALALYPSHPSPSFFNHVPARLCSSALSLSSSLFPSSIFFSLSLSLRLCVDSLTRSHINTPEHSYALSLSSSLSVSLSPSLPLSIRILCSLTISSRT